MGSSSLSGSLFSREHENLKEQLKYMQFFCKVGGSLIKGWWATIWAEASKNDIMVGGNLLQAKRTKEKSLFEQLWTSADDRSWFLRETLISLITDKKETN